ncbi:MAG TPA: STAS domain-containing protein [Candidatus Limnocylindrales bacterium]|nr:STAS domain-containing protein [Candidatus Limnocylindrales bacterium]
MIGVGERADGDPAIVRLAGEQDVGTRDDVRFAFQRVRDNPRVIVDLTKLRYIDSTVISELMRAESRTSANDGKLVIVARNQRILRVLSIAGITARTPILDTLDSAMKALRPPH